MFCNRQSHPAFLGAGEPAVSVPKDAMVSKNKKVNKTVSSKTLPTTTAKGISAKVTSTLIPRKPNPTTMRSFESTTTHLPNVTTTSTATVETTKVATPSTTTQEEVPETITLKITTDNNPEDMTTRWIGTNPCELSPDKGVSGGIAQKMWYFEESTLSCQPFTFLGSGGNANRFKDKDECQKVCGSGMSFH
ncbi:unnamed protein product [Strongylus vulgaris]|uniref:BPTI/Kunitz inhibitor domain-containing protein n=1 Tax=Strongylus vulgaris TaxID=40348 RepID=A0A3P7JU69_STRVU|nr:unnamed protein product [Strongylus vulgaris]